MRLVDLSTVMDVWPSDAPHQRPVIEYRSHADNLEKMASIFKCDPSEIPEHTGWATEVVTLTTHSGCHIDAPYHYFPTMNNGEPARRIHEMPLEWCYQDGVHFDFTDQDPHDLITVDDVKRKLDKMEYTLKPLDIVLVESGAGPYFGKEGYRDRGAGFGKDSTLWLLDQGIKVVGTDSYTWDRPFSVVADTYAKTKDQSILWEGHRAGRYKEYYQMEKLGHLDELPAYGFKVICFPIPLYNAGASWIRCVAVFDE